MLVMKLKVHFKNINLNHNYPKECLESQFLVDKEDLEENDEIIDNLNSAILSDDINEFKDDNKSLEVEQIIDDPVDKNIIEESKIGSAITEIDLNSQISVKRKDLPDVVTPEDTNYSFKYSDMNCSTILEYVENWKLLYFLQFGFI